MNLLRYFIKKSVFYLLLSLLSTTYFTSAMASGKKVVEADEQASPPSASQKMNTPTAMSQQELIAHRQNLQKKVTRFMVASQKVFKAEEQTAIIDFIQRYFAGEYSAMIDETCFSWACKLLLYPTFKNHRPGVCQVIAKELERTSQYSLDEHLERARRLHTAAPSFMTGVVVHLVRGKAPALTAVLDGVHMFDPDIEAKVLRVWGTFERTDGEESTCYWDLTSRSSVQLVKGLTAADFDIEKWKMLTINKVPELSSAFAVLIRRMDAEERELSRCLRQAGEIQRSVLKSATQAEKLHFDSSAILKKALAQVQKDLQNVEQQIQSMEQEHKRIYKKMEQILAENTSIMLQDAFKRVCMQLDPTFFREYGRHLGLESSTVDVTSEDCLTFCGKFPKGTIGGIRVWVPPTQKQMAAFSQLLLPVIEQGSIALLRLHGVTGEGVADLLPELPECVNHLTFSLKGNFSRKQVIKFAAYARRLSERVVPRFAFLHFLLDGIAINADLVREDVLQYVETEQWNPSGIICSDPERT